MRDDFSSRRQQASANGPALAHPLDRLTYYWSGDGYMNRILQLIGNDRGTTAAVEPQAIPQIPDGELLDAYSNAVVNAARRASPAVVPAPIECPST